MTDTAHNLHIERDRLIGKAQGWLSQCRAAVSSGSGAQELRDQLDDETPLYEVFFESTDIDWARSRSELEEFGLPKDHYTTSELATARVLAALTGALTDEQPRDTALRKALAHFDFSGVRSAGTQLLAGDNASTIGSGALPTMTRALVGAVDNLSRGFVMLLLSELAGQRPTTKRDTTVPVLFRTSDRAGVRGEAGILTLAVLESGPSGLHPDPATMAFLQADPAVSTGIEVAWAASELAATGACVVWSVSSHKGSPWLKIEGNSMSAAFAVALDDIADRRFRKLRPRRNLDRSCAVTAGLEGTTLTEVAGYGDKTKAARAQGYRVVVARSALEAAKQDAPPDWIVQISGATTVNDAIAQTRTIINKQFYATVAAFVIIVALVIGVSYSKITTSNQQRLATQLAAAASQQVNANSRIAALLALTADRIHSSPTTLSAIRAVADNNESVVATATAADSTIDHVAAYDGAAMTSTPQSSIAKVWSLPTLRPLGQLDLGSSIIGMGGAGYAESGMIAILAGTALKIFQGAKGTLPTQVASYETPFTDPNVNIFGPYVDPTTNSITAFDENFRGVFWTPGMSAPDTFDLSDGMARNTKLVAVSGFGNRHGSSPSARQQADTSGDTVLLATSRRAVYEFTIDDTQRRDQPPASPSPEPTPASKAQRKYGATMLVDSASLESSIYSLAISSKGSVLVGTNTGLRQFNRNTADPDDTEADVDGIVKERVEALVPTGWYSDNIIYVTPTSLAAITDGRVTKLNNTDQNTAVRRSIRSIASAPSGIVLTGRTDGRIAVHDPANTLTRLQDRWGATDIRFTPNGQLVRAAVQGTRSTTFSSVAIGNISRQTQADAQRTTDDLPPIAEDTYGLDNDHRLLVYAVDATTDRVAATGIDHYDNHAYVWVWDRRAARASNSSGLTLTLPFDGNQPNSKTIDIGRGLALSPDGSRIYAYNAGRGQMTAWSTNDGKLLWTKTIPVALHPRAALGSHVSFDHDRRVIVKTCGWASFRRPPRSLSWGRVRRVCLSRRWRRHGPVSPGAVR